MILKRRTPEIPVNKKVKEQKRKLRKYILNKLKVQKEVSRARKSYKVQEKLFSCLEFKEAKNILFYASFDGEVDTFKMIKEAKRNKKNIALPVIKERAKTIVPSLVNSFQKTFVKNVYGISEPKKEHIKPIAKENIDLVIVPGVAFDKKGNRLGRGKGYYDRFLKTLPRHVFTIGLAFDFQVIPRIPYQKNHDLPVDKILFA